MTERRDDQGRWIAGGAGLGAAAGIGGGVLAAREIVRRVMQPKGDGIADRILPAAEGLAEIQRQEVDHRIEVDFAARKRNIAAPFKVMAGTETIKRKLSPVTRRLMLLQRRIKADTRMLNLASAALSEHIGARFYGRPLVMTEEQADAAASHRNSLLRRVRAMKAEAATLLQARPVLRGPRVGGLRERKSEGWEYNREMAGDQGLRGHQHVVVKPDPGKVWLQGKAKSAKLRASDIDADHMAEIRESLREDAAARMANAKALNDRSLARREGRLLPGITEGAIARVARMTERLGRKVRFRTLPVGLVAGAAAGALAGYGAHELGKAAPSDSPPNTGIAVSQVGERAGATMAERLATTFRGWKDEATSDLLHAGNGALSGSILSGLDYATRPISTGFRGGMRVPVDAEASDGEPTSLSFTFTARQPAVERYIEDYRQSKIAYLADEQQQAIKAELIAAAREGAGPDAMARRIREMIGLTPHQAAQVQSYRRQLEALDPAVLGRAGNDGKHDGGRQLRDRRYDRVVAAAIREGKPLSPERVQRMVDAYHRRALALRAMTIARTEGVGAANNGHILSLTAGLEANPELTVSKTWMATDDARTRHDHRSLHGKTVFGLETPFRCDDGSEIRWPHDPSAPAKQVILCRCVLVARLVPRRLVERRGLEAVPSLRPIRSKMDA